MAPASALVNKIKVQLKLSVSRLRMVQQKDTALAKQQRRELAQLLEQGKYESAKIRVENVIRTDLNTELLEVLELYCELLTARAGLLEAKECDPGLEEAIKSIVYAAPRIEGVKELSAVRQLLAEKYGKEFILQAVENSDGKVPERVLKKVKVEPPAASLVEAYLEAIAEAYAVEYPPGSRAQQQQPQQQSSNSGEHDDHDNGDDGDTQPSSGGQNIRALEEPLPSTIELSKAAPPDQLPGAKSPVSVVPPSPRTDNIRPTVHLPSSIDSSAGKKTIGIAGSKPLGIGNGTRLAGPIPDVDELQKRFALLKR